jgi:hypothetical protein
VPTNEQLSSPLLFEKVNLSSLVNTDKAYNEENFRKSLKNSEDSQKIMKNVSNVKGSDPQSSQEPSQRILYPSMQIQHQR